jgi:triosephosphate isomerase (TIM)
MRKKLIAGNWKMHGSAAGNTALLQALVSGAGAQGLQCELSVCVPALYLPQAAQQLAGSSVAWGAQDCSAHRQGAYTGEISAAMLTDFGCRHVIVGHSERRQYHGETSALVAQKALRILEAGMSPIVCVGETLDERERGDAFGVVGAQLEAVIDGLKQAGEKQWIWRMVLAYEPVWAIGTGKTASSAQAQEVHAALRAQWLGALGLDGEKLRVIYGGSVKPANAAELFAQKDIDGGLIGGASLKAEEFLAIAGNAAG